MSVVRSLKCRLSVFPIQIPAHANVIYQSFSKGFDPNKPDLYNHIYLDSTWSNRNCWKQVQHSFLYDLIAKGHLIRGADGQRVKSMNEFYFHSLVSDGSLYEVQDLDESAYIFIKLMCSLWDLNYSKWKKRGGNQISIPLVMNVQSGSVDLHELQRGREWYSP